MRIQRSIKCPETDMRATWILLSHGIIFFTGAAGLIYQVAWQRYLSRLFGADSIATAIILAAFLGGLSLGYFLFGKVSTRIRQPLRGFALLEGMIGIWGLAFPWIFSLVDSLTLSWSFSPPFTILFQGILCSSLLIGVPVVCMGGTIPLMTRGISRDVKESTRVHARIYSINTAGAVLGTLLAGFVLIPRFGLPSTVQGTAVVNLSACLFFLVAASRIKYRPPEAVEALSSTQSKPILSPFPAAVLYTIALISGFYAMTLENVLIRFVNFSLGSSSYSFSMIVAVFILSIAIGSWVIARLPKISSSLLFWNQFLIVLFLLAVYYSLDVWPYGAHLIRIAAQSNPAGFIQYNVTMFLTLTGLLIFPVACMGATIPLAFHELKRELHLVGRHSGLLLSWNTVGNLTGSIIGGIVLFQVMGSEWIFLSSVLLASLSVCLVARFLSGIHLLVGGLLTLVAVFFMTITPFFSQSRFSMGMFRTREPLPFSWSGSAEFFNNFHKGSKLLFYEDDPIASVAVLEFDARPPLRVNPLSIMINGKSDSSTGLDAYTIKLLAHLPALLAKERKEVLIIGLGTGVTAGEMALYSDVERIDVAEISPAVIRALPYFKNSTHSVHENPKLRILKGDAFRILSRSDKKWDIIVSEPSNPWVTGVDQLFTREFYRMVKSRLAVGGIFVQWAHQYESSQEMLGMIFNTVQSEFPEARLFWPDRSDLIIVMSQKALTPADVLRAQETLHRNERVRESLRALDLDSIDSLLIREVWTPSYFKTMFHSFEQQTMDHPKLHYIANKAFFNGAIMDPSKMWNAETTPFIHEYLMAMKYPDWRSRVLTKEELQVFQDSLRDHVDDSISPINSSVGLKAFLGNPNMYRITYEQGRQLGLDVLQFIINPDQAKLDWGMIGLHKASFRRKGEVLLDHVQRTRNWIVPYRMAGLESLLRQGMKEAEDPREKTWCALQLSLLLLQEKGDRLQVKTILRKMTEINGGQLEVAEQDRLLQETVTRLSVE